MDIPLWQDTILLCSRIVVSNNKIAQHFFENEKNKELFLRILGAELQNKIDSDKPYLINSLLEPFKILVENLLSTPPVLSLLIEAEIKSLFIHRYQYLKNNNLLKENIELNDLEINLEDFCAFFKPLMENKPKIFEKALENLCEIGTIQYKKKLSNDKNKFIEITSKLNIQTPKEDFIFRCIKTIKLKKCVNPVSHNLDTITSSSKLVLLIFKDILFKMNKQTMTAKVLTR
jgi:hypothetical protein